MNTIEACIMIIDDEPSDLDLIKRALSIYSGKNNVLCMNSGKEALAYLMGDGQFADRVANPYPSMLITDLKMPEVDGFEILEYLQNNPTRSIIPTVVLSSSEDQDDIHTAYKLGANSYFVKPYKFDELCSQINTLLHYWNNNKRPIVDPTGKHLVTDSKGKLGARFYQPN